MATVLITAGPTREHLDDVRFLSNGSTGRMGYAIARAARDAGHDVVLVSGPTALETPPGVERVDVVSALEMQDAVERRVDRADVVFGVAAVADARPAQRARGKPPKTDGRQVLELVPNPDVIAAVGRRGGRRAVVGFALEALDGTGEAGVLARARAKLERKHLDAIAVNLGSAIGAARSSLVVLWADGREERVAEQDKTETARRLVEIGWELWRRKR